MAAATNDSKTPPAKRSRPASAAACQAWNNTLTDQLIALESLLVASVVRAAMRRRQRTADLLTFAQGLAISEMLDAELEEMEEDDTGAPEAAADSSAAAPAATPAVTVPALDLTPRTQPAKTARATARGSEPARRKRGRAPPGDGARARALASAATAPATRAATAAPMTVSRSGRRRTAVSYKSLNTTGAGAARNGWTA